MELQCVCKGIRYCGLCENLETTLLRISKYKKKRPERKLERVQYDQSSPAVQGVFVIENFITAEEEAEIINRMNSGEWIDSQSGRRKQDFGPKANFKRRKAKLGSFVGIPIELKNIFSKMNKEPELIDFLPVEALFLEYDPLRGAHIEPHYDDDWLWDWFISLHNYKVMEIMTLF